MKIVSLVLVLIGASACEFAGSPTDATTTGNRTAPPAPSVTATTTTLGDSTQAQSLQVSAVVHNPSAVTLYIAGGGQCPIFVTIVPGTGVNQSASPTCSGSGAIQLAAHDSVVFTQVVNATVLAVYQPGAYSVDVTVMSAQSTNFGTGSIFTTALAGTIELPLGSGTVGVQP